MSFDKEWSNYVLHNIDAQKLDQIIINLECKIVGCRSNNKKGLKSIPQTLKIGALNKRLYIEKEIMEEVEELYKTPLEKEEMKRYLQMTPTEFLAQIDTFKEQEEKDVQIGIVNYFLKASTTLDTEKDEIVKHFNLIKKENKDTQVIQTEVDETIKNVVVEPIVEEKEQLSRKEAKDLKILKHLYEEAKQKEQQQEQKIKKLIDELSQTNKTLEDQKEAYKKELNHLKSDLKKLQEDYENLESEKESIEDKLKQTKIGAPYVIIGSKFIRKKLDKIKSKKYPQVNAIYISTEQWKSGLGKVKDEVAEVYAFFYDIEWLTREMLYEQYGNKLKVFPTDEHFYDYIEQHWEA